MKNSPWILAGASLLALAACGPGVLDSSKADSSVIEGDSSSQTSESYEITDSLGRKVTIKKGDNERIVCVGAGSLRAYVYVNGTNNIVGVEQIEKTDGPFVGKSRPYKDLNADAFANLTVVGTGGPKAQAPEPEKILSADPTLVFSMLTDASAANELQNTLGVPVVCLAYGTQQVFDAKLRESLTIIGKIMDKEERAAELTSYIESVETELNDKTKDIPDSEKQSVYLGCLGNFGVQDIYSSCVSYPLFEVSNIKNVLDGQMSQTSGYVTVDPEKLLTLNPDRIILDSAGVSKFKTTYLANKDGFDSMKAFRNGEVYLQLGYNVYYTNIEVAMADAYYNAKVAYPDLFKDLDITVKTNEITNKFLGADAYDDIAAKSYGGFQKITSDFWDKVTATPVQ